MEKPSKIKGIQIIPVEGIGEVRLGDRLGTLIASAAETGGNPLREGDVVVVTQKAVSKAEGGLVKVRDDKCRLDVVVAQSRRILRKKGNMLITETQHGFVCANAGVDASNIEKGYVSVLPKNPDASARRIKVEILTACGISVAVIVSDTFGRPWRRGQTNVAIGVAGMNAIIDYKGTLDTFGRTLEATEIAVADEVASAAELVMGKALGIPAVIVRGVDPRYLNGEESGRQLLRPASEDLFR